VIVKKRLSAILLALLIGLVVGCQDEAVIAEREASRARGALEESNKALAERYVDAYSRGDIEALRGILSPDYVAHNQSEPAVTLEPFLSATEQRKAMFPDGTFSVEDLMVKDDRIVWRALFRGTHTEDAGGFAATGKKVEAASLAIALIKDGKIVESWGILDFLTLYQQLGFELTPPEERT
jgi:predicted ester cyclase